MNYVALFITASLMLIYTRWVRKQKFFRNREGRTAALMAGMVVSFAGIFGVPWFWKTIVLPKIIYHEQQAVRSLSDADLSRSLQQQSPKYGESTSGKPKLTALPHNEAHADPTYFNFFYATFVFFVGMAVFFRARWRLARREVTKKRDGDGSGNAAS